MKILTKRKRAFTLIELLVVIAILGVLVVLGFSSAGSARAAARDAKCLNNLRQISAAAIQYFTDRNGDFFPTKSWEVYPSWAPAAKSGMRDYLGIVTDLATINGVREFYHDSIVTCPTQRILNPGVSTALNRTYSFNYYLNQKNPSTKFDSLPSSERPLLTAGFRKMSNVEKPAALWMFTDGVLDPGGAYYSTSVTDSATLSLPFPHNKRQHFAFLDGHVESLTNDQFSQRKDDRHFWGKTE